MSALDELLALYTTMKHDGAGIGARILYEQATAELTRLQAIEKAAMEWAEGWPEGKRGENQADYYFLAVLDANKKTPA